MLCVPPRLNGGSKLKQQRKFGYGDDEKKRKSEWWRKMVTMWKWMAEFDVDDQHAVLDRDVRRRNSAP